MSYTVRLYSNDDSFTRLIPIPDGVGEIQVVLAFARDYVGDKSTNGKFIPYWDTYKVTPSVITQFKEALQPFKVKVLVSIGDRNARYPFKIEAGNRNVWIKNAIDSLTSIIEKYKLDGIDVYYEHIESSQQDFDYIGQLIEKLKEYGVISVASIAPTARLNTDFYLPLYEKYSNYIDTVVYQCFTETQQITSVDRLVEIFKTIANKYPKDKLLAGYSTICKDWATVSPPTLYFIALFQLLIEGTVAGPSIWVISDSPIRGVTTCDTVSSCVLKSILEVVSLARKGRGIR